MSWLSRFLERLFHVNPAPEPDPTPTPAPSPPLPPAPDPVPVPPGPTDDTQALIDVHNEYRKQRSLTPLKLNPMLQRAAQDHANFMVQKHSMAHQGIGDGSPFDRMTQDGYNYSYAGENIAMGQMNVQEVMQAWMNSAGHRANILNANYRDIGAAAAYDIASHSFYWCVDFGCLIQEGVNPLSIESGEAITNNQYKYSDNYSGILTGPWTHERFVIR